MLLQKAVNKRCRFLFEICPAYIWFFQHSGYLCDQLQNSKQGTMKKFFAIITIAGFLAACNNDSSTETTTDSLSTETRTADSMLNRDTNVIVIDSNALST